MTFLLDSAVRMSVVLGAALLAMAFLRRRSAAVRHWVLSAAVLCAALIPAATLFLPAWDLGPAATKALSVSVLTDSFAAGEAVNITPAIHPSDSAPPWPAIVWLVGLGVSFLVLTIGYSRLMRVTLRSEQVTHGDWLRIAESVSRQYGLKRRIRL